MENKKIYEVLGLDLDQKHIISFVGAGGKSSSMDRLAKEFKREGKKVLVTTTTVIFYHQHEDNDQFFLGRIPLGYFPFQASITLLGKSMDNGKIRGVSIEYLEELQKKGIFDIILIEADGARMKALKAPASHEPVVPSFTTMTIGLIGLDSISMPLDEEHVHRPEILSSILEVDPPHLIDKDDIIKIIVHKEGIFKRTYGKQVVFLNKACSKERISLGAEIKERLVQKGYENIFVTEIKESKIYL